MHKPFTHRPCTHKSYMHKPFMDRPCTHKSYMHKPFANRPCTHESYMHKPCTHKPRTHKLCTHWAALATWRGILHHAKSMHMHCEFSTNFLTQSWDYPDYIFIDYIDLNRYGNKSSYNTCILCWKCFIFWSCRAGSVVICRVISWSQHGVDSC